MRNEDKLFELIGQMYSEMKGGFKRVDERFNKSDENLNTSNDRLDRVEKTVLKIEQDHGKKLDALLDGYKQNAEKLDRIEAEVIKHEEFIIKRIK